MKILAISGSLRKSSSNTLLLRSLRHCIPRAWHYSLFEGMGDLPVFNPDLEGERTPDIVLNFCHSIAEADAVIIACPEYVRAIPGGLKNSIDWLVSRDEIIAKPIALVHASHRGDDMLDSLRMVLTTVSERFAEDVFLRIPLNSASLEDAESELSRRENIARMIRFLSELEAFVQCDNEPLPVPLA